MNRQVAPLTMRGMQIKTTPRDAISCLSSGQSPPTPDKVQCWRRCGGSLSFPYCRVYNRRPLWQNDSEVYHVTNVSALGSRC